MEGCNARRGSRDGRGIDVDARACTSVTQERSWAVGLIKIALSASASGKRSQPARAGHLDGRVGELRSSTPTLLVTTRLTVGGPRLLESTPGRSVPSP